MSKPENFIERCYKDKNGKVTLVQAPNVPILLWLACVILQKIVTTGKIYSAFELIGFGALFTWAWLEIFQGCNYLRRLLGAVVIIFLILSRLSV